MRAYGEATGLLSDCPILYYHIRRPHLPILRSSASNMASRRRVSQRQRPTAALSAEQQSIPRRLTVEVLHGRGMLPG